MKFGLSTSAVGADPATKSRRRVGDGREAQAVAGDAPSFLDLAHKAISGDRNALEHLLVRLHTRIAHALTRRLGGDSYAEGFIEDVTQEALYRIAVSLSRCSAETDEQFLAWVSVISRNIAIDWIRAHHTRYALIVLTSDLDAVADHASLGEWDGSGETGNTTARDLLTGILRSVASSLPDPVHQLLWYRLVEGAPWSEVGAQIGTTASGAKRRFQRIQDTLRSTVLAHIHHLAEPDRVRVVKWLQRVGIGKE